VHLYLLCFVLFVLCFVYCFVYVYVFLLVLSVLPSSDNSNAVNNNNNNTKLLSAKIFNAISSLKWIPTHFHFLVVYSYSVFLSICMLG
jgi:hypothetical protein